MEQNEINNQQNTSTQTTQTFPPPPPQNVLEGPSTIPNNQVPLPQPPKSFISMHWVVIAVIVIMFVLVLVAVLFFTSPKKEAEKTEEKANAVVQVTTPEDTIIALSNYTKELIAKQPESFYETDVKIIEGSVIYKTDDMDFYIGTQSQPGGKFLFFESQQSRDEYAFSVRRNEFSKKTTEELFEYIQTLGFSNLGNIKIDSTEIDEVTFGKDDILCQIPRYHSPYFSASCIDKDKFTEAVTETTPFVMQFYEAGTTKREDDGVFFDRSKFILFWHVFFIDGANGYKIAKVSEPMAFDITFYKKEVQSSWTYFGFVTYESPENCDLFEKDPISNLVFSGIVDCIDSSISEQTRKVR